jgi:hypothetical protein
VFARAMIDKGDARAFAMGQHILDRLATGQVALIKLQGFSLKAASTARPWSVTT